MAQLIGSGDQARQDQAVITAGLARVQPGTTLTEFNLLFSAVSALPHAAVSLETATGVQPAALVAADANGDELRFGFDRSLGFRDGPYYALAVFPRMRDGPPPTFAIFDKASDTVVAKTEVGCSRAMEILRTGPILPPEVYQDELSRPRDGEIVSDSAFEVWLAGRVKSAAFQARLLRCIP